MSPGNLAIDATAARLGGGASRVRELLHSLPALAPANRYLFFLGKDVLPEDKPPEQIELFESPGWLSPAPLRASWQHLFLPRRLSRIRADWVLSPFNIFPLGPGLDRVVGKAVIVSNIRPFAREFWKPLNRYQQARLRLLGDLTLATIRRADKVFLISRAAHRLLKSNLRESQIVFLPMAPPSPWLLDAAHRVQIPSSLRSLPFFIAVGDLLPYKGLEDAIAAISALNQSGVEARLLVCGRQMDTRYARRLRVMADDLVPKSVVFLGSVSQPRALALMRASLGTVICSRLENPSRVTVEAMSVESPVVATDIPNFRETCGDAALFYQEGDHRELAACMIDLLDEHHRKELIERGRLHVSRVDWLDASRRILQTMELL